jgi:hypothetical protein
MKKMNDDQRHSRPSLDETRLSPLRLADIHLDALYQRDDAGFITASRDPSATPPRFHLVRTAIGNRLWLHRRLSSSQRDRLIAILASQTVSGCDDAETSPPDLEAARAALAVDSPPRGVYRGPAFFFPKKLAAAHDAELLIDLSAAPSEGAFSWIRHSGGAIQPVVVVRTDNDEVASVCHSARSTSLAAEAGVETCDLFRGRGYGTAVVTGWATAVRREGRVPLYSTEWENMPSRALARRLGLVCYGEDFHVA